MKKEKGVILVLTVTFMLVFTLLGLAAMQFAGFQAQGTGNKIASTKAFWIAEAGIQRAVTHLLKGTGNFTLIDIIDQDNYSVTANVTSSPALTPVRWQVDSTGTVIRYPFSIKKRILIKYGPAEMDTIQTTGGLTIGGSATVEDPKEQNVTFDFETIFGMSMDAMYGIKTYYYADKDFDNKAVVNGITFIDISAGKTVNIPSSTWQGSGLLIVRTLDKKGKVVVDPDTVDPKDLGTLRIQGGTFNGILWVVGKLEMASGNPVINGSVFVNCGKNQTTVLGNADLNFGQDAIDAIFSGLPGNGIEQFKTLSWQEIIP